MRNFFLTIIAITAISVTFSAQNGIGIGTATPDSSAELDVFSSTKGLLLPHIALTASNVALPVLVPTTGY
ncbi:MAG: hypothetical protein ABJA78_11195 [Ferruginibacter sp.]